MICNKSKNLFLPHLQAGLQIYYGKWCINKINTQYRLYSRISNNATKSMFSHQHSEAKKIDPAKYIFWKRNIKFFHGNIFSAMNTLEFRSSKFQYMK